MQKNILLITPDLHPPLHLISNPPYHFVDFPILKFGGKIANPTYNSTLPTIKHSRVVAQPRK